MHMKICRNFGAALCFVGVILWLMAGLMLSVSADSAANSLTLICKTEKVTLTGMHWDLYNVFLFIIDFFLRGILLSILFH